MEMQSLSSSCVGLLVQSDTQAGNPLGGSWTHRKKKTMKKETPWQTYEPAGAIYLIHKAFELQQSSSPPTATCGDLVS